MKLVFSGVGGAFASPEQFQTNAFLIADNGVMLIDCGSDARHALSKQGVTVTDIDAVYISHLHADHVGGMEWLAFSTYFHPNLQRPLLFANVNLMNDMWNHTLRGGLDSIEGKLMDLTDYFECKPLVPNGSFEWQGVRFEPVQTVHVMAGRKIVHSYGLMLAFLNKDGDERRVFYTSDTQFCPNQISTFYQKADLIFHDCETTLFKSGVHAHIDDLKTLPAETKAKMWLMHYMRPEADLQELAASEGFAGFVMRGQKFNLENL